MRMRKKKNGEKRIENLSALFIDGEDKTRNITSYFSTEKPLRVEIGCGKGDFICGISLAEPDYNYVAVEKIGDVIMAAGEKYAASRGLGSHGFNGGWVSPDGVNYDGERWEIPAENRGNVRFFLGDAKEFLSLVGDSEIESIYTNFSDPWPKKGYTSRRLTHESFLKEYERVLCDGGFLKLKTDNDGYFDYSLESIEKSDFELLTVTRDIDSSPLAEENIETEYEKNFKSQGIKIKALLATIKKNR